MSGDVHLIRGAIEPLDRTDARRWAPACGATWGRTTDKAADLTCEDCRRISPDHPGSTAAPTEGVEHVDSQDPAEGRRESTGRNVGAEGEAAAAATDAEAAEDHQRPGHSAAEAQPARKVRARGGVRYVCPVCTTSHTDPMKVWEGALCGDTTHGQLRRCQGRVLDATEWARRIEWFPRAKSARGWRP